MTTAVAIEPPSGVDAIFDRARHAWRPPRRLNLSAWADEYFYLSAESSAEPGKWRTLPYQKGIMDAITDPLITQVSVMKSARVGYTKIVNATVGYYMHQDPCPIMVVQPTIEDAAGYSKEEIAPMLRDCPVLAALVPEQKTRDSDSTILGKRFRGGSVTFVGANSARGFRRVSRKVVIFDEPDGYPPSAGNEGDQIQLGIRRTEYYWDRKILAGSTPTLTGISRIEGLFHAGDQRRYYVPCPHCGFSQVLEFKRFHWPKGRPDLAVYVCLDCGVEIEHKHKRDMVHAGLQTHRGYGWRAGPHAQFPDAPAPAEEFSGHASFHIWAAYSFSPNASWGQLAREHVEAVRKGAEHLKTWVNTVAGETWKDRGEAPEWERIYQRRETYAMGTCPPGVLLLTAGVDVQKDRLVYEVVGWGRDKQSWSIDAGVIPGDTSLLDDVALVTRRDPNESPWRQLAALLDRTYPHAGGAHLSILMLAVDAGYNSQTVYSWARRFPMTRVAAVRGVPTAHVLVGAPSVVDVTVNGKKMRRGYKVWPVGTNVAKTELYGWLALQPPTAEAFAAGRPYPPGYCHHPEYGEDYFKQLTAEQQVSHRSHKGFVTLSWELMPNRENHHLDARVYARVGSAIVGLDRFRESDWAGLERSLGLDKPKDGKPRPQSLPLDEASEPRDAWPAPSASRHVRPPSSAPTQRPQWVKARPNWLKGGR